MTWLSYFYDDDGADSAWTSPGGDIVEGTPLGSFVYSGSESVNQVYRIALNKSTADSLLGGLLPNDGFFLIGRVGGAYGDGNTLMTALSVEYGDGSYGPTLTFYDIGTTSSGTAQQTVRRRR